ncbi:hypothetical protein ACHAWU_000333 [Discostella pseudostelligera]|uniref:Uncharacterized protein n=1 Tax=Discostella pseudostelligera TaxID=259834 RepID=A0ABD3MBP8_9STRA
MRILTGDECGLLKEIIPELTSRHLTSNATSSSATNTHGSGNGVSRGNNVQFQQLQQQQLLGSGTMMGVQRLGHASANSTSAMVDDEEVGGGSSSSSSSMPGRAGGIVSLTFLPSTNHGDDSDHDAAKDDTTFQFAALRMNGIVETWKGSRIGSSGGGGGGGDERERNVTPGMYTQCNVLRESVLPSSSGGRDGDDSSGREGELNDKNNNNTTGWYMEQPIRPIGMVAFSSSSGAATSSKSSDATLLATCDSIGTISLLSAHNLNKNGGVLKRYNAFGLSTSTYSSVTTTSTANKNNMSNTDSSTIVLPHPSSSKNPSNSIGTLTYTKGQHANTNLATCFTVDTSGTKFAVGGRERSVVVLDVESGNVLWKAKNLPPDPQTLLQQPMWTTALQFLHTPTSSSDWFSNIGGGSGGPDMTLLATGTAYKQVQIYDIRTSSSSSSSAASSSRRPVLYTPEHLLEHRITTLCQLADGYTLAVGDTVGDVHLLDMRKMHSGKQQCSSSGGGSKRGSSSSGSSGTRRRNNAKEEIAKGRLVGPGGSIRQLYRHPTIPHYLACVGYDRKLWMWNVSSRKMVECVYLKQRLNCLLICEDGKWSSEKEEEDNMEEDGEGRGGTEYGDDVEEGDGGDLEDDEVQDYVDSDNDDDCDDDDDDEDDDDSGDAEETESEEELESGESEENDDDDDDDDDEDEEIVSKQPTIKRRKK